MSQLLIEDLDCLNVEINVEIKSLIDRFVSKDFRQEKNLGNLDFFHNFCLLTQAVDQETLKKGIHQKINQ